ncbi:MAG: EamA family transporter [Deltaproteobacteria bacterium]|jgi:transporter family protein|nr:EamA family transporter [Deltaproteobacteria bacterium]
MESWFLWTILSLVTFGFWGFFPKLAVQYINPQSALIYQVLGGMFVGAMALALIGFRPQTQPMGILFALLTGITGVLGTLFYYAAASRGQISIVVSLTALYPLITILLAILFLHETLNLRQMVGLCFAIGAIVLLAA